MGVRSRIPLRRRPLRDSAAPLQSLASVDHMVRAATFTIACVLLSSGGHTLATGMTPSPCVLALGSVLTLGLMVPVSVRRQPVAASAVVLCVLQIALHTFFALTMPSASTAAMPDHGDMVMAQTAPSSVLPTVPMLCGHAVAAAATAWLLRCGDVALHRICSPAHCCLERVLSALAQAVAVLPRSGIRCLLCLLAQLMACRPRRGGAERCGWVQRAGAHVLTRRGPPVTVWVHP